MSAPIRVVVVDDQTLVRQGIRGLLELADGVRVTGEAADGAEALELLEREAADVVLLDIRMPGMDGIATLDEMSRRGIAVPALVLTTFDDAELVLGAVRSGARGYLLKDVTLEQLADAVRTIAAGGTLLQPALTERLAAARIPDPHASGIPIDRLTSRETEVLRLVAGGYSNREIAQLLHLAEGTVKNHVSNVLVKLGARDRTQAVLRALNAGILAG